MPKPATPDEIAAQLAAAEAEAQRLRDRRAAIEQAERDARDATELRLFKEAYIGQDNYRQRRDEAKKRLDELAAAQHLDLAELLAAFDEFQRLDAQAGAAAAHASRLNQIDPLPPRANGAPRTRPTRVQRLYRDLTFSAWLDQVLTARAQRAHDHHLAELQAATHTAIDAAAAEARDKAAAGQPLNHDAPPSITELHRRAVEQIDPATFDEDNVRASGLQQARLNAEQAALKQLVAEGN